MARPFGMHRTVHTFGPCSDGAIFRAYTTRLVINAEGKFQRFGSGDFETAGFLEGVGHLEEALFVKMLAEQLHADGEARRVFCFSARN